MSRWGFPLKETRNRPPSLAAGFFETRLCEIAPDFQLSVRILQLITYRILRQPQPADQYKWNSPGPRSLGAR
jgi:hypothetical protein